MAFRCVDTGDVLSFRACSIRLRDGQHVGESADGLCAVHKSDTCVETYLAAGYLTGWSLRDFWKWRSRRRKAVAS